MTAYERCWAKSVSDCGEGMSKEHYFTRGIFPTARVKVLGTSPIPEAQRDTHIDNLVAKVLCKKHNAELSPLDDALIDLINAIREIERLRGVRAGIARKKWLPTRFVVDGVGIERCVLKMLMSQAIVQREALGNWQPPGWIPCVIFGQQALRPGCGLGVIARVGDVIKNVEEVGFIFGETERTGAYESVLLGLRGGWRLICTWDRPLDSFGEFRFPEGTYDAQQDVLRHPNRVNFNHGPRDLGISLDFDWSGRWSTSKYPRVAALRGKHSPPPR
jgi:hypothetical protein